MKEMAQKPSSARAMASFRPEFSEGGGGSMIFCQSNRLSNDFSATFLVSYFGAKANPRPNNVEFWPTQHVVLANATRCLRPRMPPSRPKPRFACRRTNFGGADNQIVNFSGLAEDRRNSSFCHKIPPFCLIFLHTPLRGTKGLTVRNSETCRVKIFITNRSSEAYHAVIGSLLRMTGLRDFDILSRARNLCPRHKKSEESDAHGRGKILRFLLRMTTRWSRGAEVPLRVPEGGILRGVS